jgi:DNA-binding CsgD family transcriptional regulator
MRLSRQEALSRLDAVHAAKSIPALLEVFDSSALGFGLRGFALLVLGYARATGVSIKVSRNDAVQVFGAGFLASFPQGFGVVVTPEGPAWERLAASSGESHRIRRGAMESGLSRGMAFDVAAGNGETSAISFLMAEDDPDGQTLVWVKILADTMVGTYRRFSTLSPVGGVELSGRELQILKWFAEGKSADETATIVGISAATVMFHYRNAAHRLGTVNRTHTVVEAVRRGLLPITEAQVDLSSDGTPDDTYMI